MRRLILPLIMLAIPALGIVSGDPAQSAVIHRMSVREWGQVSPYDDHQQMPTLGTHEVDATGLTAVETWINSLGQ